MKSTVIVFFLKIRKGNTSICVNSYNKLHILPAKLENIEFHSAANIPIIFLCMRFTFYAVQLFVIYYLIIIFFVCRFLPWFSLRGFILRGKPCTSQFFYTQILLILNFSRIPESGITQIFRSKTKYGILIFFKFSYR